MSGYGVREARINRETRVRVSLCGSCGEEVDRNELFCAPCRVSTVRDETETRRDK